MHPDLDEAGGDEDQLLQLDNGLGDTELVFMTEQLNRLRSREKRVRLSIILIHIWPSRRLLKRD